MSASSERDGLATSPQDVDPTEIPPASAGHLSRASKDGIAQRRLAPRRYHPASAGRFSRASKDGNAQRRFYLKDGETALVGVGKVLLRSWVR